MNQTEQRIINNPGHTKIYEYEKIDLSFWRNWMADNWTLSLVFAAVYLVVILAGRKWMENRNPYRLKMSLITWNVLLAAFSIMAFARTAPDLLGTLLQPNGLHKSMCAQDGLTYTFAFWALMGTLSKVAELGDTIFIVLRKQPLIFLHPYHHISVMLYTWFTYSDTDPCHRWFMTMNYFVHSLMYTYYGLRAAGVKLPRKLAMCVTLLQISQMIMGTYVNIYGLRAINSVQGCDRRDKNIYLALAMYASYFYLFVDFFKKAYFKKVKSQ